ncbi:DUF3466 family protein [Photobacterium carnosum]|uniref:DUF3466 family protein n=1 Tax=Photobacterium carnosum TaxID=2023717 RepID=UPI001E4756E3|nr:DUF3466 family protein [Photobacterium carnosum]MCD9538827.1 DUF3466 family protein [Photobacterium carnosum]MCF2163537.1 DUF3466 family protein [Photobacterium carnosum]
MPHKMLKLSTLAILIAGASQASAAVYTVVPVANADSAGVKQLASQDYFAEAQANANSTPITVSSTGISNTITNPDLVIKKESCFEEQCVKIGENGIPEDIRKYSVASMAKRGSEGTPIADTTPYYQNRQDIISLSQLDNYCSHNFGYGICDIWAKTQYFGDEYTDGNEQDGQGLGGLQKKQSAWTNGYYSNIIALVNDQRVATKADEFSGYTEEQKKAGLVSIVSTDDHFTTDAIVNGVVDNYNFGTTSSALLTNKASTHPRAFEKRGFVNTFTTNPFTATPLILLPPVSGDAFVKTMGQTTANSAVKTTDGLLVVGSSSFAESYTHDIDRHIPNKDDVNIGLDFKDDIYRACATTPTDVYNQWECQFSTFANEAAFWLVGNDGITKSGVIGSNLAAVDPDDDHLSFQASAQAVALKADGNPIVVGYSTNDVNNKLYAIQAAYFTAPVGDLSSWTRTLIPGLAIREDDSGDFSYTMANGVNSKSVIVGDAKGNGTKPQRAFIYQVDQGNAKFFDQLVPSLFFKDSNSNAAAINNNGQVVGWVDVEASNGAEARHRAFTYIYGATVQGPLKAGGAWMLDDLTNDNGAANSEANSYRILNATSINNAGVIAATASYCQGGYANLSKLAHCNSTEQQVIVKLVPNANATAADIHPRAKDEEQPFKRSGGSLGILALTALGFIGFRRRK